MPFGKWLTKISVTYPVAIAGIMAGVTLLMALAVALPTLWPDKIPLPPIRVDTDPENMLDRKEPVRVFHNDMKRTFALNDIVVVGVVNEKHPDGVFNTETLQRVYELTEYAKTLRGENIGLTDSDAGVVIKDIIAPSTVDNIEQGGPGEVKFEWLMDGPPETPEEALAVRDKASKIPFLAGTMVSESGKALALYIPITSKDLSYRVYTKLTSKIAEFGGDEEWHITGLPVANDTFGVEMFLQMAISAPLAMLVIFLLMIVFFRKPVLIIAPMILALVIVIINMGLLVVTGNTIHIMSSMIPIFIMPVSILDSIHILSEFFESYQKFKDRRKTLEHVMGNLFSAMLYTSLTSAAGFASLAITPIPPVQIFGIFVAIGVMIAWFLTVTFLPAYIMLLPERTLEKFGSAAYSETESPVADHSLLGRLLAGIGRFAYAHARVVLITTMLVTVLAFYGITLIQVNDNPTRWFKASHPIRVADRVLNKHFGGTYMAYLTLKPRSAVKDVNVYAADLETRLRTYISEGDIPEAEKPAITNIANTIPEEADNVSSIEELLEILATRVEAGLNKALDDMMAAEANTNAETLVEAWEAVMFFVDMELQRDEVFKHPDALAYMEKIQAALADTGVVGKSNSLVDIVKTVYRELMEGDEAYFRIPDTPQAVAQCLITYESSHRPHDLGHFVTHDYRNSSVWVQLKSGNNKDMKQVQEKIDAFIDANPPPMGLEHRWFGLTYINVIWQEKMVVGMLQAFLGSFLVVLLMMVVLFRSGLWGLLSMIPLTVTIGFIYGMVGVIGKDYDMPVAVLSSLTLGLAVDFSIHFLSRTRDNYGANGSWKEVYPIMFGEPARAIVRNVLAVSIGFTPLLAAPLVPYNTVGIFMAAILGVSGVATLFILPSIIRYAEPLLFPRDRACQITCRCGTCIVTGAVAAAAIIVNAQQFLQAGWTVLSLIALAVILVSAGWCYMMSRSRKCVEYAPCRKMEQ